ncbi:protein PSK SIMULATOR 1-like isoform X2 [Salvia miltiorrhiza]|nr:protein PSK SIMULATOR 1-like isoform X2 [Salvia miltiorrhiza]
MMSKVVKIWQSVTVRQISRLKEEIANSVGIHKLVSEDDDYLMDLALAEIINNLMDLGKSVAMLGKKCEDSTYHNLETVFDDPSAIDPKWHGWQYRLKKMDRKVKKMEKFVAATEKLHSELEELAELEQSLKRMQAGANLGKMKLIELRHQVLWQRQEVKSLQELSPWVRTYDYVVRLLLRSLFTIIERIKYAFGSDQIGDDADGSDWLRSRCNSMSGLEQTSEYSSENEPGGCMRRTSSNLASRACKNKMKGTSFYDRSPSSILCGKQHQMIGRGLASVGLTGCMTGGMEPPVLETYYTHSCGSSFRSYAGSEKDANEIQEACTTIPIKCLTIISSERSFFLSKRRLLNAPPSTLGYTALALHYAHVIVLLEKLASSPHLISLDARDDLYDMLPSTIRSSLWAKLKAFSTTPASSEYDAALAAELSSGIAGILDWLSPLARNMIRWQSERNFERERVVCGSNILLVQTLHFANQAETEAAITELLMGLSYLFRFGKDINFREPSRRRAYFFPRYNMHYDMIDHIQ